LQAAEKLMFCVRHDFTSCGKLRVSKGTSYLAATSFSSYVSVCKQVRL
jgi:hypothetical protein